MKRAVIFANGERAGDMVDVDSDTLVVAADGGLRHALARGIHPAVVIGDLDSAPNELVQIARARGAEVIQHPVDKDKTDLELAIDLVQERGAIDITVIDALGGRIDHELATILLLASPNYRNLRLTLAGTRVPSSRPDGRETDGVETSRCAVTAVTSEIELEGSAGDIISLLPVGGDVRGVLTSNLQYPLAVETLFLGSTRGMSNVMTADKASVVLQMGTLLVCHISSPA